MEAGPPLQSATELAALVRSGEVSALALAEAALGRIEALDPQLNAFTTLDAERALSAADAIEPGDERPFCGVPIAVKDLGVTVAGVPLSNGSDLFADFVPPADSFLVRRLREAGCVIVGVTNSPEMGIPPVTEPRRFGPTRNPWDLERVPGGSSGGSAAAVAGGMVPLAHASDGGGSIRIPAACCGLVGLKPSRGRVSSGPALAESLLAVHGVLTHTVEDTAVALDAISGYEPGDANWAPEPDEPFAASAAREPERLRIGWSVKPALVGTPVDPTCVQAARDAAELLEELGHEVEEVEPPWGDDDLFEAFIDIFTVASATGVAFGGLLAGREPTPDDVEKLTWWAYERARSLDSLGYSLALTALQAAARAGVAFCLGYDAVLTPVVAERPLPIGTIDTEAPNPAATFRRSAEFAPFTAIFNLSGQPAISVPLFHGDDGLPLAVHIVGRPLGEGLLLSLAAQLEAARPWRGRVPELATEAV